jgi:hypothetical protein
MTPKENRKRILKTARDTKEVNVQHFNNKVRLCQQLIDRHVPLSKVVQFVQDNFETPELKYLSGKLNNAAESPYKTILTHIVSVATMYHNDNASKMYAKAVAKYHSIDVAQDIKLLNEGPVIPTAAPVIKSFLSDKDHFKKTVAPSITESMANLLVKEYKTSEEGKTKDNLRTILHTIAVVSPNKAVKSICNVVLSDRLNSVESKAPYRFLGKNYTADEFENKIRFATAKYMKDLVEAMASGNDAINKDFANYPEERAYVKHAFVGTLTKGVKAIVRGDIPSLAELEKAVHPNKSKPEEDQSGSDRRKTMIPTAPKDKRASVSRETQEEMERIKRQLNRIAIMRKASANTLGETKWI